MFTITNSEYGLYYSQVLLFMELYMAKHPTNQAPLPIFDTAAHTTHDAPLPVHYDTTKENYQQDYKAALAFLYSYKETIATFNAYRREVERLLLWTWHIRKKHLLALKRVDIEEYLNFCQKPPKNWIGKKKVAHFIVANGEKVANPEWRPFVVTQPKTATREGKELAIKDYQLSDKSFREIFAVLSSFYNFLIQENVTEINPIMQIRQKSKYLRRTQGTKKIRRLSELQWSFVIETAEKLAEADKAHERTLFILSALYGMYLRVSELTASKRWLPKMNDFQKDNDGNWWFTTVGKGNKERQIAVSEAMLKALKRWRHYRGLSPLPSPDDNTSIIPKERGSGPISSTNQIRNIVQYCFDEAVARMREEGLEEESMALKSATVHWLRHTGISDDVKFRPREHVRDDAGHSSSAITDKYIDIELRERHASARKKEIKSI